MHASPFSKVLNGFIRIQRQFRFKIDSSGVGHVDSDAKNGGTFDELYSRAGSRDFEKQLFDHCWDYRKSEHAIR
jgi:hypothetical protein